MQQDYNNTINLPKTEFPMRAGLPKREPGFLENWEKNDLYHELMKKNEGKPLFVLHDGPPYANGNLHTIMSIRSLTWIWVSSLCATGIVRT